MDKFVKAETMWLLAMYAEDRAKQCETGECGMGGGVGCAMVHASAMDAHHAARDIAKAIQGGLQIPTVSWLDEEFEKAKAAES